MHFSHLTTHGFSCSTLGSFDIGGTSSKTGVNRFMMGEKFCYQPHTLLYLYDSLIHGCMGKTSLSHLKSPCFYCSLFGSNLSGDSSFTSWMNILMRINSFWSIIIGHGILTNVIGAYLIGHLKHVCTWQMVFYSLGGISTFMTPW